MFYLPELAISAIRPLQPGVSEDHLFELADAWRERSLPPVTVVPDPDEAQKYLLVDGAHTTFLSHVAGSVFVAAECYDTDEDIRSATNSNISKFGTLEALYSRYKSDFRPDLLRHGIVSIGSVPVRKCTRSNLARTNRLKILASV